MEIKAGTRIDSKDWKTLRSALRDLGLARAWVVNQGTASYSPMADLQVIPAEALLGSEKWSL